MTREELEACIQEADEKARRSRLRAIQWKADGNAAKAEEYFRDAEICQAAADRLREQLADEERRERYAAEAAADEDEEDVVYRIPDGSDIADPYLREVWNEAVALLDDPEYVAGLKAEIKAERQAKGEG